VAEGGQGLMADVNGHQSLDDLLIVLGSDDRYSMPLAVTLFSGVRRVPESVPVRVVVVDAGITEENKVRIEGVAQRAREGLQVEWVTPEMATFDGLRTTHWGSPASYLPLLIPQLIAEDRSVLYLDSDLLIRGNLNELWEHRLEAAFPIHAVLDYGFHEVGAALKDNAAERLGIDASAPYFNSGVLLIDLPTWRRDRIAERALEFAREHPDVMRFTDQDALNAIIQGGWEQLDPRWNVLVGSIDLMAGTVVDLAERESFRESLTGAPHIMHFSGQQKPWKPGYARIGRREYLREVADSRWFDSAAAYWRWRIKLAVLSPFIRSKRRAIKLVWPLVTRFGRGRRVGAGGVTT
jgi:lipopolysaccharide biosynthesis glycosyltransferase